jgi:hypothetical protein
VLFEIERHLLVADLPHQRPHEEPAGERRGGEQDEDAESEDGRRAEAQRFERVRRRDERGGRGRNESHGALHRELHSPAAPDVPDDVDQGRSWIAALVRQHRDPLRICARHAVREHGFTRQ